MLELLSNTHQTCAYLRWAKRLAFSAWRPFSTVENAPLVITDRRTVLKEDLLEVDKVLPDKVEKAYYLLHRGHHKWYYMSHQTPEDVALFMTWSSQNEDTIAGRDAHVFFCQVMR